MTFRIPLWWFPKQTLRIMKLTSLFILLAFLQVSANVYSQNNQVVQIKATNQSIVDVLKTIEDETNFTFLFNRANVDVDQKVNMNLEFSDVEKALDQLLEGTNIKYRTFNNSYVLYSDDNSSASGTASQQTKTVKGQVTSEKGDLIPGVTVFVKGTSIGTITDTDGKYSLQGVPANGTLVFSFVGMKALEVPVQNLSVIDVTMEEETIGLEEVVAIGYGTVKKKDLTGAVSTVKADEISIAPVVNPVEAIQGRVAGLDITRGDGRAGGSTSILLRGNRSLTASSEPIYIIDGIQGSISNLNPNDIESMDILKDASSTAIYGSAGANGVIIVTTKQARRGKIQVDLDSYVSVNGWPSYPSALQGDSWLNYLEEGYYATNGIHSSSMDELLTAWGIGSVSSYVNDNKWVDWVDETLQTGVQQNYSVSIRGGTETVQANFSLGYNKVNGIYKNDFQDKATMRSSINVNAADWIKFGLQTGLTYTNGETRSSRINKAFGLEPIGDVYDQDGNINVYPAGKEAGIVSLLADDIDGTYKNNTKAIAVTANPFVELTLAKGLTVRSILGTSITARRNGVYNSDHTYMMLIGSANEISNASYNTSLAYSYNWENILNYKFTIGEDHDFTTTLISSYAHSQHESSSSYSEGFLYDDFEFYNLDAGLNPIVSSSYGHSKRMSVAARAIYSYKGKYIINASVREDAASQLAKQWDIFPAGAFAWRVSDENFMAGTKNWLSNLKLRLGYGVSGNSNISAYVTRSEVTSGVDALNLGGGQLVTNIPTQAVGNTDLGWEKSYNMNIGLDFGLFDNRIDGSLEWYDTDTKDVIYARNLPYSSGGYTAKIPYTMNMNIARMSNKGLELTLNTRNIQTDKFKWNSTFTFARNWEEVTSIDLGSGTTVDDLVSLGLFMGSPKNTVYDYKKIGIWQTGEEADAAVFGLAPGDVKIESSLTKVSDGVWEKTTTDDDGNAVVTQYTAENPYTINASDDRQIVGQGSPKWTAGFQNSFKYKNFNLDIFMTARWGQMIEGELLGYFGYGNKNLPDMYNYWTEDNPTNDFPRPYLSRSTDYSSPTAGLNIVDGSFVKVKNITLGYTFPKKTLNTLRLSNLYLYGTLYNPFVFAKSDILDGVDPETNASDSFPLYKQVVFGVNVSF
ncbi:TonB-linked SusC/RagA family outer membrane protein [Mangrovibacterium marinum]|uniref:TonB-linked SusC/RagA family outer membrane protein n=2 Tax=Mangrovibacterium marinum TaxID=1639118 RepID=A0A2T5C3Z0_9BACT|nr:TonB-linked SusC/RagA family outer membrane protein [Mangrovibacterium marinum]